MQIHAQTISFPPFVRFFSSRFLPTTPFLLPRFSFNNSHRRKYRAVHVSGWWAKRRNHFSISSQSGFTNGVPDNPHVNKRKIVEHIFLLKANVDITNAEEQDMLDYLYTSQYHMSGILSISLGRLEGENEEKFTHAIFMRFQKKEEIAKFYNSEFYSRILKDHVAPFSYGSVCVDFESEVDDDIIPLFRRGEDFNYGVECILLISGSETVREESIQDALTSLQILISHYSSFIVQATIGTCIDGNKGEYSHAAIIRFPSREDFVFFKESLEFKNMWNLKINPIAKKALMLHYSVDPVGTELM
ncbi:hypothetical protein LUZ60_014782 [Juncus effusus]|nr:hypothetical protein LUZ60_014782 [Juncus effusus]